MSAKLDTIAIDIGTSKCRLAICKEDYIQIVEHECQRAIPSFVAYSDQKEWLVGKLAENYAYHLENVFYDLRWLLDKYTSIVNEHIRKKPYFFKFNDETPFQSGYANFIIQPPRKSTDKSITKLQTAKEFLKILIETILKTALDKVEKPQRVVLTVPIDTDAVIVRRKLLQARKRKIDESGRTLSFMLCPNEHVALLREIITERFETIKNPAENKTIAMILECKPPKRPRLSKDDSSDSTNHVDETKSTNPIPASKSLDFDILIIEETLAALASYHSRLEDLHHDGDPALVFCLGARYFQIALYFINRKNDILYITRFTDIYPYASDTSAGLDIDQLIYEDILKKIAEENNNVPPKIGIKAERRLRKECEKIKSALSFAPHTRFDVDSIYMDPNTDDDKDFATTVRREDVQQIYGNLIKDCIQQSVRICKEIKPRYIVLAGGSTRIPLVASGLLEQEIFQNSTILNSLNVDEVAAMGAAAIGCGAVVVGERSFITKESVAQILEKRAKEQLLEEQPVEETSEPNVEVNPLNTSAANSEEVNKVHVNQVLKGNEIEEGSVEQYDLACKKTDGLETNQTAQFGQNDKLNEEIEKISISNKVYQVEHTGDETKETAVNTLDNGNTMSLVHNKSTEPDYEQQHSAETADNVSEKVNEVHANQEVKKDENEEGSVGQNELACKKTDELETDQTVQFDQDNRLNEGIGENSINSKVDQLEQTSGKTEETTVNTFENEPIELNYGQQHSAETDDASEEVKKAEVSQVMNGEKQPSDDKSEKLPKSPSMPIVSGIKNEEEGGTHSNSLPTYDIFLNKTRKKSQSNEDDSWRNNRQRTDKSHRRLI